MNNAEQFRRYLKRIEIDGKVVINKDACLKIIERCERWIFDRKNKNFEMINSFTFDVWAEQDELLDELLELCKKYRGSLSE